MRPLLSVLCVAFAAVACHDPKASEPPLAPTFITDEPQRTGDAEAGYLALVTRDYVGCGLPEQAYDQAFGAAAASELIERPGNVGVPYYFTRVTRDAGYDAVTANCLYCHASHLFGEIVIGLGNASIDMTGSQAAAAELAGFFIDDAAQREEWRRWADHTIAIDPYLQATTRGVNAADNLTGALFSHRDPETLAWSEEPYFAGPSTYVVPVDTPPWWRMAKKNAMFYSAAGRGDQARIMMTASSMCTDTTELAASIDDYFGDVRAYIISLEPPVWPFAVDAELAADGRAIFEDTCSRCHGTYAAAGSDEAEDYPNLLVPWDLVQTDVELLHSDGWQTGGGDEGRFASWFNASFYGETARFEPSYGYVAPPLDGIWATAPFLHNGSVPTLAALLDSRTRPSAWQRTFATAIEDYDTEAVGWKFTLVEGGKAGVSPSLRERVYDTTQRGYGNGGHTFGDDLTSSERQALLEYLKTL